MSRKIGVILSCVMMIFEVLSTLLLTPFIIRTLGPAEYGVYKLSASVVAYLLLLDLGVGNAITRYIAKFRVNGEKEQTRKFFGVATIYYAIIAVIAVVAGAILILVFPKLFAKGLTAEEIALGQKLLFVTMLNAAITLGTAAFNNVIIAYERFAVSKGASILQIIIRMVCTVVALKCGLGSVGIVVVNLIMTVICRAFFVLYVLFFIKLTPMFKKIEAGFIKEIVIYSSMILLQMIATQLNATVDQVLIGAFVASSATILAVYSVGAQVTQYFQSIGTSFTGVLMPGIVNMVEHGADAKILTDEMIRIGRIIFMVLGLIFGGFLACGQQFIVLWAGEENISAYFVALILMAAHMFVLVESIGTQILWAMNQHKEQAILKIVIVLLNILLTIALIQWEPLYGATIGTFISIMLGDVVVMNIVFRKKMHMSLLHYYKGLIKGILPCIVIATIVGCLVQKLWDGGGWLGLMGKIAIICIVYAVCMFTVGMNAYEKKLASSLLSKLKIGGKQNEPVQK